MIIIFVLILSFFLWAAIHEYSHLIAVKTLLSDVSNISVKLYPHYMKGTKIFRFAAVYYTYGQDRPTLNEQAIISLAPNVANIVAAFMFPFGFIIPFSQLQLIWYIIWGAGLVDLAKSAFMLSEMSDGVKACRALKVPLWTLRLFKISILVTSLALAIYAYMV